MGSMSAARLLVARGDAEGGDDLGLVGLGVGDVGARAAAEPAGGFVVADEDSRVMAAVAVLDPDLVALLEAVLDRLVAHALGSSSAKCCKAAMSVIAGPWPGRTRVGLSSASLRIERRFSPGS